MTPETRRIRLDVAYDGTDFFGWQFQPRHRTVQGVLERVLTRLNGRRPVRVRGAGRTDAGVHARGQVADADIASRFSDERLHVALQRMLPQDVRPVRVRTVSNEFTAQYRAKWKTYRYRVDRSWAGDPFRSRYALHHPQALDLAAIEDALQRLPGRRDWSGFAATACVVEDRHRTMTVARMESPATDDLQFEFTADGFLLYMVRNIVGTLLEIGRGRFEPERIDRILDERNRHLGGATAAARGLTLERIEYDAKWEL